jgi:hypothetical protein
MCHSVTDSSPAYLYPPHLNDPVVVQPVVCDAVLQDTDLSEEHDASILRTEFLVFLLTAPIGPHRAPLPHLLPLDLSYHETCLYRVSQEEMSIFWEVTVSVILSKKSYMYTCPIPNGFRDRAISLYSSKSF